MKQARVLDTDDDTVHQPFLRTNRNALVAPKALALDTVIALRAILLTLSEAEKKALSLIDTRGVYD
jgi:hypothetical protein